MHHLCQGEWERRNSHPDTVTWLCCRHHPNYKYKHAPDKKISPPRCTSPPHEVFPTASPADSSITGAPVANRKKQKKTSNPSGARTAKQRENRKKKGAAVDPRKRKSPEHTQQMVAVEEGTADNDNAKLSRKMSPKPTQQMKKRTLFALKEIDRRMFEEGNADNIELGDMCVCVFLSSGYL